jgi:hypothetical protein
MDPFRSSPTIWHAIECGRLVECVVIVPVCAVSRVPVRVVVTAGDDWESRAETCALVTVEAVRNRLRTQALEGDTE